MKKETIDLSNPNDFSQINIENLLSMVGEIPFNVYIKLNNDKFTLILKKGDSVDKERFERYAQKGVKELFIHKADRREYLTATEILLNRINSGTDSSDPKKTIEELTEQTMHEVFEDKIFDENSLRRAQTTIQSYIDIVKNDPSGLSTFLSLSKDQSYHCRHGIATAVFSVLLARAHQNQNEKTLMIIGLGGLLHDLGMSKLPDDFDRVDRKLTPEEWAKVKTHPSAGVEIITQLNSFPEEVKLVIEQHHEQWDGRGYPRGLRGTDIYYPARIVAIADTFSALTTRRGGRSLYKPTDALALLLTEPGKYDPQLIKAFRSLFNVQVKKSA